MAYSLQTTKAKSLTTNLNCKEYLFMIRMKMPSLDLLTTFNNGNYGFSKNLTYLILRGRRV